MTCSAARPATAAVAVLAAMALVVLDAGITNVALPTIAESLAVTPSASIMVASSYQLALLMALLPAAHIAGRVGGRRLFMGGIALFTAASAAAALAPSFPALIAARFAQGVGGAAILALGIALLRSALGSDRLGAAIAWNALNVAVCAAAAPVIGAMVLAIADWPSLFLVNLPIGLAALTASRGLPAAPPTGRSLDTGGIILHAATAALLFAALESLIGKPILGCLLALVGSATLVILVRRRPPAAGLLPIDLLALQPFRRSVAASMLCFIAQSAGLLALPFYVQLELSSGTGATGTVLACWPLAVAMTSIWANRLAARIDSGALCATGALVLATGLAAGAVIGGGPSTLPIAFCAALCGIGFGLFQVPNNRNLFLTAPPERSAAAGGMQGTARLTGQTVGSVLVALLFAAAPPLSVPRLAMAVAAVFALAAALVSARRGVRSARLLLAGEA